MEEITRLVSISNIFKSIGKHEILVVIARSLYFIVKKKYQIDEKPLVWSLERKIQEVDST